MKIFTHIPYKGEINARFHAQFQFDLPSFDQNILSFEDSLNHKISLSLFYIQFILFAGK